MRTLTLPVFLIAALAASGIVLGPMAVSACISPPVTVPFSCEVTGATAASVTILGAATEGAATATFCACGLGTTAPASVITSIDAVAVFDAGTMTPNSSFSGFNSNVTTSAGFNALAVGNWWGFLAPTAGSVIVPDVPLDFRFDMTVVSGTTCAEIIEELNEQHAGLFGTDEANFDGTLTGAHPAVASMISIPMAPSLGTSGLFVLGLVGLISGWRQFDQRRQSPQAETDSDLT